MPPPRPAKIRPTLGRHQTRALVTHDRQTASHMRERVLLIVTQRHCPRVSDAIHWPRARLLAPIVRLHIASDVTHAHAQEVATPAAKCHDGARAGPCEATSTMTARHSQPTGRPTKRLARKRSVCAAAKCASRAVCMIAPGESVARTAAAESRSSFAARARRAERRWRECRSGRRCWTCRPRRARPAPAVGWLGPPPFGAGRGAGRPPPARPPGPRPRGP